MDQNATIDRPSTAQALSGVGTFFAVVAPAFILASAILGWLA